MSKTIQRFNTENEVKILKFSLRFQKINGKIRLKMELK